MREEIRYKEDLFKWFIIRLIKVLDEKIRDNRIDIGIK